MRYRALVRLTEQLAAQATRRYYVLVVGPAALGSMIFLLCLWVWNLTRGDRSWVFWAQTALVSLGAVSVVAIYFAHYRRVMRTIGGRHSVIEVVADDSNLTFAARAADVVVPWAAIAEVNKFASFWILRCSNKWFEILPLEGVPVEMQAFIEERINVGGSPMPSNKSLERTRER